MAVATPCANHHDRQRLASCSTCGNALCRECIVHTQVGIKCPTCTGEKAPAASRASSRPPGGRPRWLVPGAIAAVVVLGLGYVVFGRGGGGGGGGAQKNVDEFAQQDPTKAAEGLYERKVDLVGGRNTRIGAFLTVPPDGRPPTAGALIIPGFGTIDHDAVMATTTPDGSADRLSQDLNYSRPGTPDNLYRDLNDSLIAAGFATLRYDKRGSPASPLRADQAMSYDDLVADARAGLEFLGARQELGGKPLTLVGVDQGGLIAMRLASDPRVRAVMLVSTFGRPLADVIGGDLFAARGEPDGTAQSTQLHEVAAKLAAGQPVPAQQDLIGNLRALLRPDQEAYLRAVFGLDPLAEARNVSVPVLLVRGGRDTTVTVADSERLKGVLPAAEELVVADGDHNLGANKVRDPVVMSQLAGWLARRAAG